MALATTDDYKLVINKTLYYIDNNFGGISKPDLLNYAGIVVADVDAILADYATYKKTRDARPANTEAFPDAHGPNKVNYVQV